MDLALITCLNCGDGFEIFDQEDVDRNGFCSEACQLEHEATEVDEQN
ncbi:MAG: hypothetical protein ACYSUK_12510 [Planctomycetota bacterium]|jgi:hypothetical protein